MRKTKEIEKIIKFYKDGNSMKKTGEVFGISAAAVMKILDSRGVPKRTNGGIYKLDEKVIIQDYKNGNSSQIIAEKYGVCCHSITNLLEKYGIKRDNIYHNLELIEDYWENIDSYDKAYFLGFIITDGNVSGNMIRLQLSSKDQHILEVFAKKTKNSNQIKEDKRKLSTFQVKRKRWVEDLERYGVVQHKTEKTYLPILEEDIMPHLIRGLIDGDGWISYKSHSIGFCGSERLVTELRDFICSNLGVYPVKVLKVEDRLWQINWASLRDVEKIGNYLYNNKRDCYLERKFDNFKKIIQANTEVSSEIAKGSETP